VQVISHTILPTGAFTIEAAARTLRGMVHERPHYVTRWRNFRTVAGLHKHGAKVDAARRLERTPGQISHFGSDRPTKNIGDDLAAAIEEAWGLPRFWLDQEHEETGNERPATTGHQSQPQPLDPAMLAQAEDWVRFEEAMELGAKVTFGFHPMRHAQRLIAIYETIKSDGGSLSPAHAAELTDQVRNQQGENGNGRSPAGRGVTAGSE